MKCLRRSRELVVTLSEVSAHGPITLSCALGDVKRMTTTRYLALSSLLEVEACEYPDSQKAPIVAGEKAKRRLRKMVRGGDSGLL